MRYNKRSTLGNALMVVCVTALNEARSAFEKWQGFNWAISFSNSYIKPFLIQMVTKERCWLGYSYIPLSFSETFSSSLVEVPVEVQVLVQVEVCVPLSLSLLRQNPMPSWLGPGIHASVGLSDYWGERLP